MHRTVEAELLDSLPPQAPAALRSRRDLGLINSVMGNRAWFRRVLPELTRPGERVLEIGAGDGGLARRLRPEVPHSDGLDLWPRPPDWPRTDRWHQEDVRQFRGWDAYAVVFGNLICHHFPDSTLAGLGAAIRRHARVFAASEPARGRRYQLLFSLLCPLIRAHEVTRHDGRASIAAGFADDELPRIMGFFSADWTCRVRTTPLGAYRLIALRP
ncbi:MAG TPA: methyltransferase domain-containing protein [Opitutaceae bacterium]|nr:methyltransferase domain-containing protein [Opitutaceae bacterium]